MTSIFLLGFLLGLRHALEADHVLAVASLSEAGSSADAIRQGVVWGVGHTTTLLLVGGTILFFDILLTERVGQILEFAVGIMLVILGVDLFRKMVSRRIHLHAHKHADGVNHIHFHAHSPAGHAGAHAHHHVHVGKFPVRALLVGLMHGLAGSSALLLLTLKTVQSPTEGVLYILLFGLGSIISMGLLSVALAIPLRMSLKKVAWLYGGLQGVIATATVLFGVYIIYSIGVVDELLL